ncbi:glycosyltransferase family 2 protein [Thomasclavelia cocleata]|jgi:glycosyltransferase involved in cell wall biosynthesis|uniref:glycosyltransferase family 2 protein n=1 Tax=Thomasclavelia cocleata TaxID=69824 RepID=UPI00241CF213|nr:glycosyltransferase family 2 protein [Thomasclavelia cocleata]MCI9629468.1 glycosyltransferase family 2 protein [Thomasclavelia cocleata]
MDSKYKVSIIIPVFNAEDYLSRCLDSVINQTYKNIEVIAVDDGSNDNSSNILDNYANKYKDIICVYHQKNIGVSKTRNNAIKLATGDYLMFMDNDDYIDTDYVERFVYEILKGNYDVVIGGYRRPNNSGKIIEEIQLKCDAKYSKYRVVAAWAKIYRLDYIKENNIEFLVSNIGEDINFTIQAVLLTDNLKVIDYIGYNWFFNEKSVSNTAHKNLGNKLQFEFLINNIYKILLQKNLLSNHYIEYYFIKLIVWFFLYASRGSDYSLILKELDKNFRWLEDKFPLYKTNPYLKMGYPKGESLFNRLSVYLFIKMHNLHVIKIFLFIYSKI